MFGRKNRVSIPQDPPPDSRPQGVRYVNAPVGPPVEPPLDRALARQDAEGAGIGDAARRIYDPFSFMRDWPPVYLRQLRARRAQRIAGARQAEDRERKMTQAFVDEAEREKARADAELAADERSRDRAVALMKYCRATLLGEQGGASGWQAPHRVAEPPRSTTAREVGVIIVATLADVPWGAMALQVLGASLAATWAMAVVLGLTGVMLGHFAGSECRRARAGEGRHHYAVAAVCLSVLVVAALFLADARFAMVASPMITANGQTVASGVATFHLVAGLVFAGWVAATLGIWGVAGLMAYGSTNPYVRSHQRAEAARVRAEAACIAATAGVAAADAALDNARLWRAGVGPEWEPYRENLHAFFCELEQVYLHALIRGVADPQFSTVVEVNVAWDELPSPLSPTAPTLRLTTALPPGDGEEVTA